MALFPEFTKASYQDWLNQLQKELKGADPSRFTHYNLDGITFPTYISAGEITPQTPLAYKKPNPDQTEGANAWIACVEIDTDDLVASNKIALQLLEQGANALRFKGIGISNQEELRLILRNIRPDFIHTHFDCGEANPSLLFMFFDELQRMKLDTSTIQGSLAYDPLGDYAFNGFLTSGLEETIQIGKALVQFGEANLPAYKTIMINGSHWHNAGASAAGELAFILADMAEYLCLIDRPEKVAASMAVRMASGSDFFVSLAKFRSMRVLWARMLGGYGLDPLQYPLWISSETSQRNKTIFDPWNNQLRATSESMAAILAGADELTVHPYDSVFRMPDEHSRRIALNVHHILRYESHLDVVADAAAGADYIEKISEGLSEAAWDIFLQVEKTGGFLASLRKGWIQEQVATSRKTIEQDFRSGKRGIVGINRFVKAEEIGADLPTLQKDPLSKLPEIKLVEPFREAALIEQIRKKFSQRNPLPHAFLAMTGNPKRAADRAAFAADFMAMAGISSFCGEMGVPMIDQLGSTHAKKALLIILCGADEDYLPTVDMLEKGSWPQAPIYIAGKPAETVQLLAKGISGFIYLGCDSLPIFYQLSELS